MNLQKDPGRTVQEVGGKPRDLDAKEPVCVGGVSRTGVRPLWEEKLVCSIDMESMTVDSLEKFAFEEETSRAVFVKLKNFFLYFNERHWSILISCEKH